MKTHHFLSVALAIMVVPTFVSAQILWDNDGGDNDLMNQANWGDGASGTPNTNPSSTYQIDTDTGTITWNTASAGTNAMNATLNHNLGTVSRGSGSASAAINGTYNLNSGASLDLGSASNVTVATGVFNFNGGSLATSGGNFLVNNSAATVNVNANLMIDVFDEVRQGVLNLNTGTFAFTGTGDFVIGGVNNNTDAFVNVFDGSLTINSGELQFGSFGNAARSGNLVFKAGGTGSVSASALDFSTNVNNRIDFENGTFGSLTVAGYGSADYESIWDNDFLYINGQNKTGLGNAAFADTNFQVNGNTLSVVPEPSSVALLIGAMGAMLIMRRRR